MSNSQLNPAVDFYFTKAKKWQKEIQELRIIILDCGLTEELKWGCPCYSYEGSNIVLIHVFKEYCACLFFKGVLLKDPKNILIQQTKNVQSARQMRFINTDEIIKMQAAIKSFIQQAIKIEKAGVKVKFKETADFNIPEEFQIKLNNNARLKTAFQSLTPGRQRSYLFHFSQPKLSQTRESRIEKNIPKILNGKGLLDE